jgi:hypothetical protein
MTMTLTMTCTFCTFSTNNKSFPPFKKASNLTLAMLTHYQQHLVDNGS